VDAAAVHHPYHVQESGTDAHRYVTANIVYRRKSEGSILQRRGIASAAPGTFLLQRRRRDRPSKIDEMVPSQVRTVYCHEPMRTLFAGTHSSRSQHLFSSNERHFFQWAALGRVDHRTNCAICASACTNCILAERTAKYRITFATFVLTNKENDQMIN
jgi:hypothetical protein